MLDKQDYTHANLHVHAPGHVRTRTHRQICDASCFSTATKIHERVSVLRYTYIARLLQLTQAGPGSHPACASMGTGVLLLG